MEFIYHDGGRIAAGYRGARAGDCVARSVAIASGRPYKEIYDRLAAGNAEERVTKHRGSSGQRTARNGIHASRKWFKELMRSLGFEWTPTMRIGTGCRVHLDAAELPAGRLVVAVSRHYTAVVDGVIYDTYDPQRATLITEGGVTRIAGRCVYGYWRMS